MTDQTHGTGIEWTHVPGYKGETWNPVRGCVPISPGCKHCYAKLFAERWIGVPDPWRAIDYAWGCACDLGVPTTRPAFRRDLWPLPNAWMGVSVDLGPLDLSGIHWAIIGGESGPGARPFDIDWAEQIVIQCKEQGVPVFLKQMGAAPVRSFGDMPIKIRLKSKKGSDEAEWPSHLRGLKQFPQIVRAA